MSLKTVNSSVRFAAWIAGVTAGFGAASQSAPVVAQHFETFYGQPAQAGAWLQMPPTMHQPFAGQLLPAGAMRQHGAPLMQPLPYSLTPQPAFSNPFVHPPVATAPMPFGQVPVQPFVYPAQPLAAVPVFPTHEQPLGGEVPLGEVLVGEVAQDPSTSIPEGYDPAYPIEYPGSSFQGYYPTDGGVIGRPSDLSGSSLPAMPGSATQDGQPGQSADADPERRWVPGTVVDDQDESASLATSQADTDASRVPVNQPAGDDSGREDVPVEKQAASEPSVEVAGDKETPTPARVKGSREEEQAAAARQVMQQEIAAAQARAVEAEEKATAVAAQFAEVARQMEQLKSDLAAAKVQVTTQQSSSDEIEKKLATMRMRLKQARAATVKEKAGRSAAEKAAATAQASIRTQVETAKRAAADARKAAQVAAVAVAASASQSAAVVTQEPSVDVVAQKPPVAVEASEATGVMSQAQAVGPAVPVDEPPTAIQPAMTAGSTAGAMPANAAPKEAHPAAKSGAKPTDKMADAAADATPPVKKPRQLRLTVREQVELLEAEREVKLKSATEAIRKEFSEKIEAKLDSGKTEKHPEVQSLRSTMKDKLETSDEKVRRAYQRKINQLWKAAAAKYRN